VKYTRFLEYSAINEIVIALLILNANKVDAKAFIRVNLLF